METSIKVTIRNPIEAEQAIGYLTQFGQVRAAKPGDKLVNVYDPFIRLVHPSTDVYSVTAKVYEVDRAQVEMKCLDGLHGTRRAGPGTGLGIRPSGI